MLTHFSAAVPSLFSLFIFYELMVDGHPPLELQAAVPAPLSFGSSACSCLLWRGSPFCVFMPAVWLAPLPRFDLGRSDDQMIGSDSATGAMHTGSLRNIALLMRDLTLSADE